MTQSERTALEMLRVIVGNARFIQGVPDFEIPNSYDVPAADIEAARSIIATAEAREDDWHDFPPGGPSHEGDDTREDEFQFPPRKCSKPECNGTTAPQAALRCSRWLDGGCELATEPA